MCTDIFLLCLQLFQGLNSLLTLCKKAAVTMHLTVFRKSG